MEALERILSEIEALTKMNGKAPKELIMSQEIRDEIQDLSVFKDIKVIVQPSNNFLNWCLS